MELQHNLGIIEDPRTPAQKALDFKQEDIVSAGKVIWKEKPKTEWKSWSFRDQDGSSSCCGQGSAKAGETFLHMPLSAHPIYRSRSNFPDEGMWLQDVGNIWKNIGTTTEALDQSQLQNEATMNRPIDVPLTIKAGGYVFPNAKDIDAVALAIETGGHCILVVHGSFVEWSDMPVFKPGSPIDLGHCVCAVDYFLYEGKKVVLIDDSWGHATTMGNGGQRLITEDYLKARFDGAMRLLNVHPIELYVHKFDTNIKIKDSGDEVIALQRVLVKLGFLTMPKGVAYGYYGDLTAKALYAFQVTNKVADEATLAALKGTSCGPLSRAALNKVQGL